MATQSYIIAAENRIIDGSVTGRDCDETREAYLYECSANGGVHYPENHDCWGTLWVNADTLHRIATRHGQNRHALARLVATLRDTFGR